MAKSSSFFNVRSGSTKSHTYAVTSGLQITKSRMAKMTNPRTYEQTIARIVAASTLLAWNQFSNFCNMLFEGFTSGNKTKQEFLRVNMRLQKEKMYDKKSPSNFMTLYNESKWIATPSHYIVAKGSLPALDTRFYDVYFPYYIKMQGDFTWGHLRDIMRVRGKAILIYVMQHVSHGVSWTKLFVPDKNNNEITLREGIDYQTFGFFNCKPRFIDEQGFLQFDDVKKGEQYDFYNFASRGFIILEKINGKWHNSTCQLLIDEDAKSIPISRTLDEWTKNISDSIHNTNYTISIDTK